MKQAIHLQVGLDDVRALCGTKVNLLLHALTIPDDAELVECEECWRFAKASGQKVVVAT